MEAFFSIFQKFFPGPPGLPGRGHEQTDKRPNFVRQPQQNGQNQAAQGEKIGSAPQRHGGHVVDAHLSVVRQQGEGEQPRRGPQPEQQVQQEGQADQLQGPAQGAHPVVDEAQQRPQQEALPEDHRLAQYVDVHKSAQQPGEEAAPAPGSVVLVADGVDISLHL